MTGGKKACPYARIRVMGGWGDIQGTVSPKIDVSRDFS